MKNSKKILALALVLSVFLVSCNNAEKTDTKEPTKVETSQKENDKKEVSENENSEKEEIEAKLIVLEGKKENLISEKEIKVKEGTTLYEALNDNFDIVVDETGMLTAIDGKEQVKEKNKFWTYTANDEMVMEGIKDYVIKKDDIIKLKLSVYEG